VTRTNRFENVCLRPTSNAAQAGLICIIDDETVVRASFAALLRAAGYSVRTFAKPCEFLACGAVDAAACLVLDVHLGDACGLDFQQELRDREKPIPVILISGYADIPMTVRAMRAGAVTVLRKPFDNIELLAAIDEAVARDRVRRVQQQEWSNLRARFESLTPRERDVLGLVTAGLLNKQIAARLELSEITVKIHRGNLMRKMEADSLADLVRMAESLGVREAASRYSRG
jgi:FixJ family two-component response regulator